MNTATWRGTGVRWMKFNFVGAIGIGVQLSALWLLNSGFHLHYLLATALAVESAVLHNFVWHERFTWADRSSSQLRGAPHLPALGRCGSFYSQSQSRLRESLVRLLRFNLTTGAISIGGNMLLMGGLVGQAHLPLLLANAITIAGCSVVNFVVSDRWVFRGPLWPTP